MLQCNWRAELKTRMCVHESVQDFKYILKLIWGNSECYFEVTTVKAFSIFFQKSYLFSKLK